MLSRLPSFARPHVAALRALLVLTLVTGVAYPLVVTAIAQLPGLKHRADGSLITTAGGRVVGSTLIGQNFTHTNGTPLARYFQPRPSAAGETGYDPTATAASNLGPEQIVDTLPNPKSRGDAGKPGLLTLVCRRSVAVGKLEMVDGRRPYCTADGVGAVLSVLHSSGRSGRIVRVVSVNQECPAKPFLPTYHGVPVRCATYGVDYRSGQLVPVRGPGRGRDNPVPPDAVTASGSGLDPDISPAYARLQITRVARTRGLDQAVVRRLVHTSTTGRVLGFMGEPAVDVPRLNLALDEMQHGSRQ